MGHTEEIHRDLAASPQESHGCESHESPEGHLRVLISMYQHRHLAAPSYRNVLLRLMKLRLLRPLIDHLLVTVATVQLTALLVLDRMFLVDVFSHDGQLA